MFRKCYWPLLLINLLVLPCLYVSATFVFSCCCCYQGSRVWIRFFILFWVLGLYGTPTFLRRDLVNFLCLTFLELTWICFRQMNSNLLSTEFQIFFQGTAGNCCIVLVLIWYTWTLLVVSQVSLSSDFPVCDEEDFIVNSYLKIWVLNESSFLIDRRAWPRCLCSCSICRGVQDLQLKVA